MSGADLTVAILVPLLVAAIGVIAALLRRSTISKSTVVEIDVMDLLCRMDRLEQDLHQARADILRLTESERLLQHRVSVLENWIRAQGYDPALIQ